MAMGLNEDDESGWTRAFGLHCMSEAVLRDAEARDEIGQRGQALPPRPYGATRPRSDLPNAGPAADENRTRAIDVSLFYGLTTVP